MDYFSGNDLGSGFDPRTIVGWGSGEMQNSSVQQALQATNIFRQQFQNLVGRPPTQQELGQFQSQAMGGAINAPGDLGYSDASNLANAFIQQSYTPQMQQYAQQQQQDQLGKSQNLIQNLINQTMQNTSNQFKDPNSQLYQNFAGQMNNLGITPSSGAFQAGAGSTIANAGLGMMDQGLGSVGIPAIQGIQGLASNPNMYGNNDMSHITGLQDWGLETGLASMLANQSAPSGFEKDLGYANMASNIFSNVGTGGLNMAMMGKGMTWICTALKKAGLLDQSRVDTLHWHLYRAFWRRPFKFLGYLLFGRFLVLAANKLGVRWSDWKTSFWDKPMCECDPAKAVDVYAASFWELYHWVRLQMRIKSMIVYHHGSR